MRARERGACVHANGYSRHVAARYRYAVLVDPQFTSGFSQQNNDQHLALNVRILSTDKQYVMLLSAE